MPTSSFKDELRALILSEHSRAMADAVVQKIATRPERLAALVELLSEGDYRLTQRAAYPLGIIGNKYPEMLQPHLHGLILKLREPAHPALHRNIVRLFEDVSIPPEEYGALADACFKFLYAAETPVAIKCFSMTALHRICLAEPELAEELCFYIEERLPYETAAFKSRGKKILAYWRKK